MTSIATINNFECELEVQPPTPIMPGNSTFSEFADATQQDSSEGSGEGYLQPIQVKTLPRQNSSNSGSFSANLGSSAHSQDLSASGRFSDTASNGASSTTHDPYNRRGSQNPQRQMQRQPSSQDDLSSYQQEQQSQQQQYGGQQQQLPPSFQQASQGRQRSNEHQMMQQQQQGSNEDLFPSENLVSHPYPQQQQQSSSFESHTQHQNQSENQNQNQNQSQNSQNQSEKPFPECCYHKALVNRMEFIQPPGVTSAGNFNTNTRSNNYLRVFVGQCRFEATPAEVRWLIHYLTQVLPVKVELRGTGCFMAYVQDYEEVHALLQLKEKLLFDHTGVWYARDEEQASFLRRYVHSYVSGIGKGFRLPKDMVVLHDQQQVQQQHRKQEGSGMRSYGGNQQGVARNGGGGGQNNRSYTNNFYQQQQQQQQPQQQYQQQQQPQQYQQQQGQQYPQQQGQQYPQYWQ